MLLTLGLPVFNDVEGARRSIPSLIQCVIDSRHQVELIISDNCSDDDVFDVATNFCEGISNAIVLRQDENLGFRGNLLAIAQRAQSEYIWFVGAGEIMVPDEFPRVLDFLETSKLDWGTVGGIIAPGVELLDLDSMPEVQLATLTASDGVESDLEVVNHLISLNVFRREVIEFLTCQTTSSQDVKKDYWPHFEAILQFCQHSKANGKTVTWFNHLPLTVVSPGNPTTKSWDMKQDALDVFFEWYEMCSRLLQLLPNSMWLEKKTRALRGEHLARFIFMLRKFNVVSRKVVQAKLRSFHPSPFWYSVSTASNFMPLWIRFTLASVRGWLVRLLGKT